ncbi:MAG: hypothetical protein ACKOGM_08445 [Solirubrobacterales bacterium]
MPRPGPRSSRGKPVRPPRLRRVDAFDRDPESLAVLVAVAEGSSSVDPIAGRTGFSAAAVLSILTRLEIEGLVEVSSTGEVVAVPAAG